MKIIKKRLQELLMRVLVYRRWLWLYNPMIFIAPDKENKQYGYLTQYFEALEIIPSILKKK